MEILHEAETWVAVGVLIVIGILLWKRVPALVASQLDARAATIRAELDEARRLRHEAEGILADYKQKAANAEAEAGAIIADAKADAERFATEARAALSAQIERRAQQAKDKIAAAESAALAEIRGQAVDLAVAAAEKLIASRMDDKTGKALIDTGIKDASAKLN